MTSEKSPRRSRPSRAKAKQATSDHAVVYPATDASLPGVSWRPTIADAATAARLVASRAFRYEAPEPVEGEPAPEIEVVEFDEAERPALDRWVSPIPHGEHYKAAR